MEYEEAFVRSFEDCTLSNSSFRHRDHLRLAWIYVRRLGAQRATARMAEGILRFATHHGKTEKYDAALTDTWMRRVTAAWQSTPNCATFDDFLAAHPELLDR